MLGVMIIPTGIGCEIGGHAGDSSPVAKMLGACCDKLIIHPNVVNASDINEMPENSLYVEGSILDRFLNGSIELEEVKQNKILVATNHPVRNDTINATSAGRATIGINAEILELDTPLRMIVSFKDGRATGNVLGWKELVEQVSHYSFDALAIHTPIEVSRGIVLDYFRNGGVNPWGGVEALGSKLIATALNKPVAHAPTDTTTPEDEELYFFNEIVDPRIAPEDISKCFFHCVLRGLNKAPRIGKGISVRDIDFMVSPYGCWGEPHKACEKFGIPIIMVRENKTILNEKIPDHCIVVDNYWEVAGIVMSMKSGIHHLSVRRPLLQTKVINKGE